MAERAPVPYDLIDHTADLGVVVRAGSPEGLYARVALVTAALVVGESPVRPVEERGVAVEGEDRVERLVALAGEVLYLLETERFVPARAEVVEDGCRVRATLHGEAFDPARHWVERQLKAATFHGAAFEAVPPGGFEARLLFDV